MSVLEDIDLGTIEVLEDEPLELDKNIVHLWEDLSYLTLCERRGQEAGEHTCLPITFAVGTHCPTHCPTCGRPICEICRTIHDIKGL